MRKVLFYTSLAIISCILSVLINLPDWDLWARLAVGSIFFQTGGVLKHDIFAYTPTKPLWVDHEWGTGVIFFFILKHFGELGFFAFKAIIIFAVLLTINEIIKLYLGKGHNVWIIYYVFLAVFLINTFLNQIRSQIFTFLFFTLWIYVLERIRRGENRLIWLLPATMMLWVNLHGGFVAGIGLIIIYGIGELLNRKNPVKYLIMLVLTLIATLVNPYGYKLWIFIKEAILLPRTLIGEWYPLNLSEPTNEILGLKVHVHIGFVIFSILAVIIAIRFLIQKKKPDWVMVLLFGVTFYLGLKHQRHTSFLILAASGLLYPQIVSLFSTIADLFKNKLNKISIRIMVLSKNAITSVIIVAFAAFLISGAKILPHLTIYPDSYPVGSYEFIKQNNLSGNLGTTYNWGSYALWKLYPQCRVLIDGRYEEVYSYETYLLALNFSEHQDENWPEVFNRFHTDIIVLPMKVYTQDDLVKLKNWVPVYQDKISVVLLPANKIRNNFVYPNPNNRIYWHDDFSKNVNLSG